MSMDMFRRDPARAQVHSGEHVSRISAADTRYRTTRVPVHEHSRARPRDYIGVRTVGRWDERERIVVRTRRLPTELIGCSSERGGRRGCEKDERSVERVCERRRNDTEESERETAVEAVERRDRIRGGRRETSPWSLAKDKARREEKGSTRVEPARTRRRSAGASERERAYTLCYVRLYVCMRMYRCMMCVYVCECVCMYHTAGRRRWSE